MRFDELNDDNYLLFAIKFYNNPHALTKDDFEDDLKRIKYVKRLLKRYKNLSRKLIHEIVCECLAEVGFAKLSLFIS